MAELTVVELSRDGVPIQNQTSRKYRLLVHYGDQNVEVFLLHRGGWTLVGADASGLELRCLAHYMHRWDDGDMQKKLFRETSIPLTKRPLVYQLGQMQRSLSTRFFMVRAMKRLVPLLVAAWRKARSYRQSS